MIGKGNQMLLNMPKSKDRAMAQIPGKATFRKAMELTEPHGGLVSNTVFDRNPAKDDWQHIRGPFWTRQLLIHPAKGGTFGDDDIVDPLTGWIFPASDIPKNIKGIMNYGLVVVPQSIEDWHGRAVVHAPYSQTILYPFMQQPGEGEIAAGKEGIPLAVDAAMRGACPVDRLGFLWRTHTEGVRPIVRDFGAPYDIIGGCSPEKEFGIVYAIRDEQPARVNEKPPASSKSIQVCRRGVAPTSFVEVAPLAALGNDITYYRGLHSAANHELQQACCDVGEPFPKIQELIDRTMFDEEHGLIATGIVPESFDALRMAAHAEFGRMLGLAPPSTLARIAALPEFMKLAGGKVPAEAAGGSQQIVLRALEFGVNAADLRRLVWDAQQELEMVSEFFGQKFAAIGLLIESLGVDEAKGLIAKGISAPGFESLARLVQRELQSIIARGADAITVVFNLSELGRLANNATEQLSRK